MCLPSYVVRLQAAHELGLCERYLEAADLFEEVGNTLSCFLNRPD